MALGHTETIIGMGIAGITKGKDKDNTAKRAAKIHAGKLLTFSQGQGIREKLCGPLLMMFAALLDRLIFGYISGLSLGTSNNCLISGGVMYLPKSVDIANKRCLLPDSHSFERMFERF